MGRYITSDPIGLEGGLNTYAYVENNPLNLIDPLGESSVSVAGQGSFHYGNAGASGSFSLGKDDQGKFCFQMTTWKKRGRRD